jgi:hypothetical protein
VKLKLIDDNAAGFEFPLSVYGIVAVRDKLDSRRNILFSRTSASAQELTKDVRTYYLAEDRFSLLDLD